MFDGLREHVGWRRLYEKIRADKDRFLSNLAKRLMSGEEVSQDEILFHRAFYFGAEYVLGQPEEAHKSLEEAAQKAWRTLAVEELFSTQEGEEPYA